MAPVGALVGFRVRVQGSGCMVQCSGFMVQCSGFNSRLESNKEEEGPGQTTPLKNSALRRNEIDAYRTAPNSVVKLMLGRV